MLSLKDASDIKLLFRYVQATHHGGKLFSIPQGLLRMQSKLDSFIKVACPSPQFTGKSCKLNSSWATFQTTAMQAHYNQLKSIATDEIRNRPFSSESFDTAWSGALKWAKKSLGRKRSADGAEGIKTLCRQAAQPAFTEFVSAPGLPIC